MYCIEISCFPAKKKNQVQFTMKNVLLKGLHTICNTGSISQKDKNQYQGVLEPNKGDVIHKKNVLI